MAVVCSKVLLIEPPLIYTAPDTCVFGAVNEDSYRDHLSFYFLQSDGGGGHS